MLISAKCMCFDALNRHTLARVLPQPKSMHQTGCLQMAMGAAATSYRRIRSDNQPKTHCAAAKRARPAFLSFPLSHMLEMGTLTAGAMRPPPYRASSP